MATTYEAIATVTVGSGGTSEINFTSIAADWTDLLLKLSLRSETTDDWVLINFNGSSNNFSLRALRGSGSSVDSYSLGGNGYAIYNTPSNYTANTFNNCEVYIPNYASSNNKSFSIDQTTENNATLSYINLTALLWSNTAAITSITIKPTVAVDIAQHSTATLYGIKNTV